ncbi:flagellar basal body rod protein FlgC [Sphingomonas sp. CFBP 13720]|uniref:flagellar basal body rod protein FlgC n=1 Tax=Sphingomonas sp. CFBP 13720 TaxID=2775302 RepID=UPI001782AA21|nr:flagellar basal body rod C-terminal domain-containing protein [Sphingomonas sp. CFBP 13720]MBD8679345.1 flagellar basal-body rod protein FlgC [Sphingomonas sp. CFBP 13720]
MDAARISRTGLDVEWQRLQVIAANIANANSSGVNNNGVPPYHAMRLVSGPAGGFRAMVGAGPQVSGVTVLGVEPVAGGVRRVHEPGHPHADAEGFVTYPGIDQAGEMALMIRTARAYEANLTAMGIAHQMYARALELGKQA